MKKKATESVLTSWFNQEDVNDGEKSFVASLIERVVPGGGAAAGLALPVLL